MRFCTKNELSEGINIIGNFRSRPLPQNAQEWRRLIWYTCR
ncbi:MAG: hypothetical protein [Olavius algarvensis Gamma 3 endosymbiont]|nr:MAG: hypothetical protein [Olavius algarvensis Gamma 3 endosymbiont]